MLGPQFEPDLLEEVADVKSAPLTAALNEAERARIVTGPSGRRDITWRFAHQLTCQMLTAAIAQPQRQRLHLRVADAMTRLDHESRVHVSRMRITCTGPGASPIRTEPLAPYRGWRRGARDLCESGCGAALSARPRSAAGDKRRHDRRLAVQERLADLLALLGDRRAAMEHYATVSGGYRAARATVDQARIARKTGTLHWQAGDRAEAMALYRRALEQISGSTAHIEAAHLYQELGLAAFRSGDNQQAIEWSERALQSAERALTEPGGDAAHVRTAATTAVAHATNTIGVALARSGGSTGARADRAQPRDGAGSWAPMSPAVVCESRRHL